MKMQTNVNVFIIYVYILCLHLFSICTTLVLCFIPLTHSNNQKAIKQEFITQGQAMQ